MNLGLRRQQETIRMVRRESQQSLAEVDEALSDPHLERENGNKWKQNSGV